MAKDSVTRNDPEAGASTGDLVVSAGEPGVAEGEGGSTRGVLLARWGERGMVSAEWAVGLIAAIAIAGVLVAIVTNGRVEEQILQYVLKVIGAFAKHLGKA